MARRRADGTTAPAKVGGFDTGRMTPQKVKRAMGGNSKPDQAWMLAEADSLEELDAPPPDCYWDVKYRWDGYSDEINPEWFDDHRRYSRQCSGISYIRDERGGYIIDLDGVRLQRPCLRPPSLGTNVCDRHGAQTSQVQDAARQRLSDAAEKAANTLITLTNPRDELNEIVEQGVRVKAANSVLDRTGIKAGTTVEVTVPGYKQVIDDLFGDKED